MLKEVKEILLKQGNEQNSSNIISAKNLKDLGITFVEALDLLRKNNIPIVLNEEDKIITENKGDFEKEDAYILVHKTNYSPTDNEIKTQRNSKATINVEMKNNEGISFSFSYKTSRDTVHFCLNGEVTSHYNGNWDNTKYSVLIPLSDVAQKENICSFRAEDTFFKGNVDITDGFILCPKEEIIEIQKNNPNSLVIGYEGDSAKGYADALLSMMGYQYKENDCIDGWINDPNGVEYYQDNQNPEHCDSVEGKAESAIRKLNRFLGLFEGLQHKQKIDIDKLTDLLIGRSPRTIIEGVGKGKREPFIDKDSKSNYLFNLNRNGCEVEPVISEDVLEYFGDELNEDNIGKYIKSNNLSLYLLHLLQSKLNMTVTPKLQELFSYQNKNFESEKDFLDFMNCIEDANTKDYILKSLPVSNIAGPNSIEWFSATPIQIQSIVAVREIIKQAYKEKTLDPTKVTGSLVRIEGVIDEIPKIDAIESGKESLKTEINQGETKDD